MNESARDQARSLPENPGCYLMKNSEGTVIYVGKAKNLKRRVNSYFLPNRNAKTAALVEKIATIDYMITGNEYEALVLENNLIKKYNPHYNILLKDDKGYPFIRLDKNSQYPKFSIVNRPKKDGAAYFGPFGGRGLSREIIDVVCKAVGLPTCTRVFPRDIGKGRPCLNYQMGSCHGWCSGEGSAEEYRIAIEQACLVLDGKTKELLEDLNEKMLDCSENLRFELAAQYRDRIRAVEGLSNKQRVIATAFADTDAVGFKRGAKTCFVVLHFNDGSLTGKDHELISDPLEDDEEAVSALVRQYYSARNIWPKNILLPFETEDMEELGTLFTQLAGRKVTVEAPRRGDRLRLIERADMNAAEEILRSTTSEQRRRSTLLWLQKALDLPEYPARIEAFDVSNLGDSGIVAAMTVYRDSRPLKRDYRKFRIKDMQVRDDYASMRQAVGRRFARLRDGDEKFSELPQLLLVDGGATHADAARQVVSELGLNIPIFGMVKDDRHRTRALVTADGKEIGISTNQAAFSLIGNIQEETHRFAIEYQRSLRSEAYGSSLDKIPGVGAKRRDDLIKAFKSVKAIRAASVEQLRLVVPKNTARAGCPRCAASRRRPIHGSTRRY